MTKLPVSVIVPLSQHRRDFFEGYVLPSIEANNPSEIIILDEEGKAPVKRNKGARKAKEKYLFFCDDDTIVKKWCLSTFVDRLESHPRVSFCYSSYAFVVIHPEVDPHRRSGLFISKPWDPDALYDANYVDTSSLVRAEDFLGFEEGLPKFQDWDLWLRMMKAGKSGLFENQILFIKFVLDKGISFSMPQEEAYQMIYKKHPKPR